jgi:ferritin-like metal-binding protein YciE
LREHKSGTVKDKLTSNSGENSTPTFLRKQDRLVIARILTCYTRICRDCFDASVAYKLRQIISELFIFKVHIMEVRTVEEIKNDSKLLQLFYFLLQEMYTTEKKQVKAMPDFMEVVESGELKMELARVLQQTTGHVYRLKNIFSLMKLESKEGKCKAISGILNQVEEIVDETEECSAQRDAGIIAGLQKIEHYEIASYSSLIEMARTLDLEEIAGLLEENLKEEKSADDMLLNMAKKEINFEASKEPAED